MANNADKFNHIFIRLIPVFNTKIQEWEREKIYNIDKIDIWNYCVVNKWQGKKDLRMYELVDDILNIDILDFLQYNKLIKQNNGDDNFER